MNDAQEVCPGLRERKKIATRDALAHAAIELALRDSPENVRVQDIVANVNVSARTFNNYFSSVPEAICAIPAEEAMRIGDALRSQPSAVALADAIGNAILQAHADMDRRKDIVMMISTNPVLRGEFFKTIVAREQALGEAIAERTGAPVTDFGAQLLASAYFGAARVIGQRWLRGEDPDYLGMLRQAVRLLAPSAAAYEGAQAATRAA